MGGREPPEVTRPALARNTAAVLIVAAWTVLWTWTQCTPSAISWHFFADGADALLHTSHLHLYAQDPSLQIGPLTFIATASLTWLPAHAARVIAQILMTAAGPLMVLWLAPLVTIERRILRVTLAALAVVPAWTVLSVRWAHPDDVLAMVFAVAAIRAVRSERPVWAGLALAAAIASKPWAIGFLPLLLVLERRRVVAFVTAGLAAAAAWAPFLVADIDTMRAFHPAVPVSPDSGLHTLGYRGTTVPGWGRTAQLLAAPAVALVAVLRRHWPGLFLAAIAVRLALDPQDLGYYAGAAAIAAAVFDLLGTRWTMPWMTIITVVVMWQPFVADFSTVLTSTHGWSHWWFTHPTAIGVVHLVWVAATVAFVLFAPDRLLGRRSETQIKPESPPPDS
jgi:hypothetical protein